MNIVIAVDSFKECLTSEEIAEAIAKGIAVIDNHSFIIKRSIADGGEGTLKSFKNHITKYVRTETFNPLGKEIEAEYAVLHNGNVVIELAQSSGLDLLTEKERNPLKTSTFGTGLIIRKAIEDGYRNFIIGLGGSATNDAALGILHALGFEFFDKNNKKIDAFNGETLGQVHSIDDSHTIQNLSDCNFTLACDVSNPFYGKEGAAHVFAAQKGANEVMIGQLDYALRSFCQVLKDKTGIDISNIKGSGAAGGVAGGLIALLNAKIQSGIDLIIENIELEEDIKNADLVFTGEGKLDQQSLNGKAPIGIARLCQKHNVPVIGIAGIIHLEVIEHLNEHFTALFSIQTEITTKEQALQKSYASLRCQHIGMQCMKLIKAFKPSISAKS